MSTRTEKFRKEAAAAGAPAALLHSPENIRYLSGFTGEGFALLTRAVNVVVTDPRYTVQAHAQAPGWTILERPFNQFLPTLAALAAEHDIKELGFEDDFLPFSEYQAIRAALPAVELVALGGVGAKVRMVKDAEEIAKLKKAGEITDRVFTHALKVTKAGMSERDVMAELNYFMEKECKATKAFDYIVASGVNGSMPHAIPSDKAIQPGDMITLDFGAEYEGYKADMTRTYAVGTPSEKMLEIYRIVLEAQRLGSEALRPGVACSAVDKVARDYIAQQGYGGNFGHGLGHGVGLQIHEQPRLNALGTVVLEPGMAVTVEPGIYLPGVGGVRIEDTCLITDRGWESLFTSEKDLIIL